MPPTRQLLRLQNEKKFDELNPKITNKIKTMSKIMGRLIMLAAIFFAPMLVLATSCGPQTEGPCNECGPHTNAWSLDYCPSQTNSSSVTPASFCNQIGYAPTMPTNIAAPIYQPGQKETHTSYDCTNTTYQYAGISYTVGSVQWDPSIPGAFGLGNVPSFSSQAYVNVTSSDTNLCPSPGRVNIGSQVTWNVANTNQNVVWKFKLTPGSVYSAVSTFQNFFGPVCTPNKTRVSGEVSYTTFQKCCNDQVITPGKLSGTASVSGGLANCYVPIPGFSIVTPGGVVGFCGYLKAYAKFSIGGSGTLGDCDGQTTICGTVGGTVVGGGGVALVVQSPNIFSISGGFTCAVGVTGTACFNTSGLQSASGQVCFNSVDVNAQLTLLGGIEFSAQQSFILNACNNISF